MDKNGRRSRKRRASNRPRFCRREGEAQAIRLVNEAANQYFVGNAQLLRRLETLENALRNNAKIVVSSDSELVNVIGEMAGVLPLRKSSGDV
jgi:regulator of protease activity HflC (stomatin/prohibitin superfamily)